MPESDKPSLVVRLIKGGGGALAVGAPLLGIPVLGTVGAVIEKAPLAELEEWVRRMHGRFVTAKPEAKAIATPTSGLTPITTQGTEINPAAPVPEKLSETEMVKRTVNLVASEPFTIAMTQAIGKLPERLGQFCSDTYGDGWGVGVWPTFTLEWFARRHFQAELGRSAAAAESNEIRTLVERGLALDAMETLVQQARETDGVKLVSTVRVWSSEDRFAWPDIDDLSMGYVVADIGELDRDRSQKARLQLLGELGRREPAALAYLSEAWLQTCAAAIQPRATRAAAGAYIDVGLCKFDLSMFDAISAIDKEHGPGEREALRVAVHATFVALEALGGPLRNKNRVELGGALRSTLRAFARGNQMTFNECVEYARVKLFVLGIVHEDPTVKNAFETALAMMADSRTWSLPPPRNPTRRTPPDAAGTPA